MKKDTVFAEFNNADELGRLRLNLNGTVRDLEDLGIELRKGLRIQLSDHNEFKTVGIVKFSEIESIWVAEFDWDIINESNEK